MTYRRGRDDYAAIRDEANDPATEPVEVSMDELEEMLGIVPPIYVPGGFLVGECLTGDLRGNVFAHYAERGGAKLPSPFRALVMAAREIEATAS